MLHIDALAKTYDRTPVFQGVSLRVRAGEFVALLGESGVGKSTLLNCIAGLDEADAGRVELDGVEIGPLPADARARLRREKLGFVFQAFHVLPHLSVAENVELPLRLLGTGWRAGRHEDAATLFSLGDDVDPEILKPNSTGEVTITIHQRPNAVVVPRRALFENNKLFVVQDGIVRKREVEVGYVALNKVEVRKGVASGELVILDPNEGFRDGQRVRTELVP